MTRKTAGPSRVPEAIPIYACNGILFNYQSPVLGKLFVTRQITRALACIKLTLQESIYLGNPSAKGGWGYAGDYLGAQWLMLAQSVPDDPMVAIGEPHIVSEFVQTLAEELEISWRGERVEAQAFDTRGRCNVKVDPRYFRPAKVETRLNDASKAGRKLGSASRTKFLQLVVEMTLADCRPARVERGCRTESDLT